MHASPSTGGASLVPFSRAKGGGVVATCTPYPLLLTSQEYKNCVIPHLHMYVCMCSVHAYIMLIMSIAVEMSVSSARVFKSQNIHHLSPEEFPLSLSKLKQQRTVV